MVHMVQTGVVWGIFRFLFANWWCIVYLLKRPWLVHDDVASGFSASTESAHQKPAISMAVFSCCGSQVNPFYD